MHYVIDGYNLLFRTVHASGELQAQRSEIIRQLNDLASSLSLDVTVVFDGAQPFHDINRSHLDRLEIIFSREDEEADDYIVRKILRPASHPASYTVITDDNRLAWRCRMEGAKTQGVRSFLSSMRERQTKRRFTRPPTRSKPVEPAAPSTEQSGEDGDDLLRTFERRWKEIQKREPKVDRPKQGKIKPRASATPPEPEQPEDLLDIFEKRWKALEDED